MQVCLSSATRWPASGLAVLPHSHPQAGLVVGEPLQVVAQHSSGFKGLATAAGVWTLPRVVELVDTQQ